MRSDAKIPGAYFFLLILLCSQLIHCNFDVN
jgi:hypothetical protein